MTAERRYLPSSEGPGTSLGLDHASQKFCQTRRKKAKFLKVDTSQVAHNCLRLRREAEQHDPAVLDIPPADHEPRLIETLRQLHRGMLPDEELFGQIGDRRRPFSIMSLDRQQGLVLLRRDAGLFRRLGAECEELA